jgi:hypothetical protein
MPLPDYPPDFGSDLVQIRREIRALQIAARSQGGTAPAAVNRFTATHTLTAADMGALVQMDAAIPTALRFPADADVTIAVGRSGTFAQWGPSVVACTAEPGVTLLSPDGAYLTRVRYSGGTWTKTGANEFWITGDLTP